MRDSTPPFQIRSYKKWYMSMYSHCGGDIQDLFKN